MRKVTLRGLLAHKLRLALTALAIVLGVTFISGTFVLTDTLNATFSTCSPACTTDRLPGAGRAAVWQRHRRDPNPLPESLVATCRRYPAWPGPTAGSRATRSSSPRTARRSTAPPARSARFRPRPADLSLHLIAGSAPTTPDDVVMDAATAQANGFSVGQQVKILAPACRHRSPSRSPASPSSGRPTTSRAPPWPRSRCRPRSGCSGTPDWSTTSTSSPRRAPTRPRSSRPSRGFCRRRRRSSRGRRLSPRTRTRSARRCHSSTRRC